MEPKELILKYWKSWQNHGNWEETRSLMKDNMVFDTGIFKTDSADQLIQLMQKGDPWQAIKLLDLVIEGNKGTLIYEGINSVNQSKIRIAEILTVEDGKIANCLASISVITEKH